MKKIIFASLALISLVSLSSCKAKQSAYRKAYEQAKQREVATQDTKPAAEYEAPAASTAAPVTVRKERVSTYSGEDATRLKRFSVVVGSFQNPTNARSLKDRMEGQGYNAVLATNDAGMLRVIVASYDTRDEAVASRDAIRSRFAPDFKDAWLLENAL
ncbi:SPOR domain-containing protein [uncultured Porphyromonas sp.]|mgnify:FL=1|uniref:SPOR domain-containing protein n=1 Tax=uncultured Porphyromonas sp. TaxID=159274 RepID=UPI002620F727|nr:SPOR domain-containing protein [uncultured Porphyromonas sp.]